MPDVTISEQELEALRVRAGVGLSESEKVDHHERMAQDALREKLERETGRAGETFAEFSKRTGFRPPSSGSGKREYGGGWGKREEDEFDLFCPFTQTWARVRKIDLEDAMSMGMLDSLDVFSSALMNPLVKKEEKSAEDARDDANAEILKSLTDPERRTKFLGMVNRVVAHAVIAPTVVMVDDGDLPEGHVFVGDIKFNDKMHIFRHCLGGSEAEAVTATFREGQEEGVGAVADDEGVPPTAE